MIVTEEYLYGIIIAHKPFCQILLHQQHLFRLSEAICFQIAEVKTAWQTGCIPRDRVVAGFLVFILVHRYPTYYHFSLTIY